MGSELTLFQQLSEFLEKNPERILAPWRQRARAEVPAAADQHPRALNDALPRFIQEISRCLAQPRSGSEREDRLIWAKEHGEDRAKQPEYTLDQMILEYQLFRETLLEVLGQNFSLDDPARQRLHRFVDEAVRVASDRYLTYLGQNEKQMQSKLSAAQEQLARAVGVSRIGFYDWDIQRDLVNFSEQMKEDWGFPAGTPINQVVQFIHDEDAARVVDLIRSSVENDTPFHTEYRVRRPSGEAIWIEARGEVTRDASGKAIRFFGTSVNISARKREEYQSYLQKQMLEAVFQASPVPMAVLIGPNQVFEMVNSEYRRTFAGKDLIGKSFAEALPEMASQPFAKIFRAVFETGEPYQVKAAAVEIPVPGGMESRFYDTSCFRIDDSDGHPFGIFVFGSDVTAEVEAHRVLQAKEESLRNFAETLPQMTFIADAKGVVTYFNERHYQYAGKKRGEAEGDRWKDDFTVHPDDLDRTIQTWARAVASGQPYDIEYRLRCQDGSYRWHIGRANPFYTSSGQISEWFGTNTDVHEFKLAAGRLQSMADNIPVFLSLVQADGTLTLVNEAALRAGNTCADAELGKLFWETAWWRDVPGSESRLREALAEAVRGNPTSFDLPYRGNFEGAPHERWMQFTMRPVVGEGGLIREVTASGVDITERREKKQELEDAKLAADAANEAKSSFLANMSHEIRTPLGSIMGFVQLMKDAELSRRELADYVGVVERNSAQVLKIIDDILDLAKVEAGKLEIERVPFLLPKLLADFAALMGFRAKEGGIEFAVATTTPLPETIVTDPTRLRQVLTNVVGNAIKFTRQGSVRLSVSFAESRLRFEVKDTGRGISLEQAKNLFRPFAQADASTTRQFGGTGLGLVLTKRLAQSMGGNFFLLESEFGKGSTFAGYIEAEVPEGTRLVSQNEVDYSTEADPFLQIRSDRLGGMRVLVVEDSPDNQKLLSILLRKSGAEVEIASDGSRGVEKALATAYDLILMDIQMPRMDGYQALRLIRENGFRGPVIAITAHAMKEEARKATSAGFDAFTTKPIESEALLSLLEGFRKLPLPLEPVAPGPGSERADYSILLVEDDADICMLLTQVIGDLGFRVRAAHSAEAALKLLQDNLRPHLVLTDLSLPDKGGEEFVRLLRDFPAGAAAKVVVISGWDNLSARAEAIGADDHLKKPVRLEALEALLERFYRAFSQA